MAVDVSTPRTRRALLGAGLGAIVAAVAGAVGRPAPTRAAAGDAVILGQPSGAIGDLFVDRGGRLWFCKGGTTWKQLA